MRASTALALCISLFAAPAAAQETWVGGSALRTRVVVDGAGDTWVGVWVDAPATVAATVRTPMAVSLVVDISGSMAGEKIRNAQLAAQSLIESLSDGDVVSIYGFSNVVTEVAPPTVLDPGTRALLMQRVGLLVAGGGTNMYGGMQVAVQRIAQAPATHASRRIFLISDGHANVGPSDPGSLGDLAARATEWGTQVTAIGVGYDYDPLTLNSMVVRSAGRLHHLGSPSQMASILEQELSWMSRSVALNARIEVQPAPGVAILEGATLGAVIDGGRLVLPLGALVAGQRREILFRVRIPTAHMGALPIATARLVFESPADRAARTMEAQLRVEIGRGSAARETPRVAAMVAQHEASESQRRAAEMAARGERERAVAELERARTQLAQTATTYEFDDAQVAGALSRRAAEVDSEAASVRGASSGEELRQRSFEIQAAPMAADGY